MTDPQFDGTAQNPEIGPHYGIAPGYGTAPGVPARSRTWLWVAGGPAVLTLFATIGAVTVAGFFALRKWQATSAQPSCTDAQSVAVGFAVTLTSIDYRDIDAGVNQVLDGATGEFKENYGKAADQLRQQLASNHAVAHGTVSESAIQSCHRGTAVLLMFVDQTVSNSVLTEPRVDRSRLKLTMQQVDNRWLASKVDLI